MIYPSGKEIINVINKFGEVEWSRVPLIKKDFNNGNSIYRPHFTSWRYKNPNELLDMIIKEAVISFNGNVDWVIRKYIKDDKRVNWSIITNKVLEYRRNGMVYKSDSLSSGTLKEGEIGIGSAESYIEKFEPEWGLKANMDIPNLAIHIEKYIKLNYFLN